MTNNFVVYCSPRCKQVLEAKYIEKVSNDLDYPVANVLRWGVKCGVGPFSSRKSIPDMPIAENRDPFTEAAFAEACALGAWLCVEAEYESALWEVNIPAGMFALQEPSVQTNDQGTRKRYNALTHDMFKNESMKVQVTEQGNDLYLTVRMGYE